MWASPRKLLLAALLCLAWAGPSRAGYDDAKLEFRGLSYDDRILVQFCLMFTDDYVALADGLFGRRTFQAITNFQVGTIFPPQACSIRPNSNCW